MASARNPRIRIPESALEELAVVESWDWGGGIGLDELIGWINSVAARFRPDEIDESARASQEFTARTFRHYQTLGCIDAPKRDGRRAVYGFRHYLQGLLLRKLIWERVPSERIAALMRGRTVEEYNALLLEGIEIVPGASGAVERMPLRAATTWTRLALAEGVELHLEKDRPPLSEEELAEALARVRDLLSRDRG